MQKKSNHNDFSNFLDSKNVKGSKKEQLLKKCEKLGISPYVDDVSESHTGIYGDLRGVVSEAELQRRLDSRISINISKIALIIAIISLIVSFLDFLNAELF